MNLTVKQSLLFNQLMSLCNNPDLVDAFYYQDFPVDDDENTVMRIFNYRMAGYELFCMPGALECRGIMFEVDPAWDKPIRLAARPMPKFFNYRENPFTMYDDVEELLYSIEATCVKEDGSLMSTYVCSRTKQLKLKSRGSIKSEQCIAAMAWLEDFDGEFGEQRKGLYDDMMRLALAGYTVNLEWCSPIHRIVLPYEEGHLRALNVRNNDTGDYLDYELDIVTEYMYLRANYVRPYYDVPATYMCMAGDFDDVYNQIKAETGIEGYVMYIDSAKVPKGKANCFKLKTDWYCSLHHSKDSVTNPRRLFECVLDAGTDDLRQMFTGDTPEETDHQALAIIDAAEKKYGAIYNHMIAETELFCKENSDLDRKHFAIKAQREIDNRLGVFALIMQLYQGQTPDYKKHLKKQWKKLGLKDEKVNE